MSVLAICLTTWVMFTITFSSLRTAIIVDMVNMPGVSAKRRFRPTLATALDEFAETHKKTLGLDTA